MVKILLDADPNSADGIRWSQRSSRQVRVPIGTFCQLQIVTRTRPVFDIVFKKNAK